jgi:hypothetical protein
MAKTRAALAALLLLLPLSAHADDAAKKWFGDYLKHLPTTTMPLQSTDIVPVWKSDSDTVRALPGTAIGSSATSTCPSVPPASCSGVADGCLYNNAGTPAFCGTVTPSALALNGGGCLALNSGGCLALNGR